MMIHDAFHLFQASETVAERDHYLHLLCTEGVSSQNSLKLWNIIGQLANKVEFKKLSGSVRFSDEPTYQWSLITRMFREADQDVVGNCINALTVTKNRSLGHRTLRFFTSTERSQRVLYCLARYAEETRDHRLIFYLSPFLEHDLSDAFLARSFNALHRLGVKSPEAINVASELVNSHLYATNMDRKAAVAAVVYLSFAGSQSDIQNLKGIKDKVKIPELKQLLKWGLGEVDQTGSREFNREDACSFFEKSLLDPEPSFCGYGCFSEDTLLKGASDFLIQCQPEKAFEVTRSLLSLGHPGCISLLARHPVFGLSSIIAQNQSALIDLWKEHNPLHVDEFLESVRNADHFETWHSKGSELLFTCLSAEEFSGSRRDSWNELFQVLIQNQFFKALSVLCAHVLIIEKTRDSGLNPGFLERSFLTKLQQMKSVAPKFGEAAEVALVEQVFSLILGGNYSNGFIQEVFSTLLVSPSHWALLASGMCGVEFQFSFMENYIQYSLSHFKNKLLKDKDLSLSDFSLEFGSFLMFLAHATFKTDLSLSEKVLGELIETCTMIQGIVDTVNMVNHGESDSDSDESENADWAGHSSVDREFLRWSVIIQINQLQHISPAQQSEFEQILKDSIRVASHITKRWIIRALVGIDSEESIKTILYLGLQHADTELVAHTIKELLPSKHPRAQQALIRCVGRSTISDELKLMVLEEIPLHNPQEILQELKTLEILRLPQHMDDAIRDTVGRVASLFEDKEMERPPVAEQPTYGTQDIDLVIRKLLPDHDKLGVDVRSALRTAEIILLQSRDWGSEAVDLSPIVNMHCKAVELTLRDIFESQTDAVIRRGVLSSKLDLLGYARPILEKMQLFEDYLSALPTIKTIPYFSKFKLRKMLRAICLYRPGKRFTLDGPKAFALFFLVTSRSVCAYGLEKIFSLPFKTDAELFEFIKLIHSLQDSRNRAVHEGLTWEAKDEIESMRSQAYKIIEISMNCQKHLNQQSYGRGHLQGASGAMLGA